MNGTHSMPGSVLEVTVGSCAEGLAALERHAEATRMHICLLEERTRLKDDAALNQEDLAE